VESADSKWIEKRMKQMRSAATLQRVELRLAKCAIPDDDILLSTVDGSGRENGVDCGRIGSVENIRGAEKHDGMGAIHLRGLEWEVEKFEGGRGGK
jgi:hypothetical protein